MLEPKKLLIVVYIPGFVLIMGMLIASFNGLIDALNVEITLRIVFAAIGFMIFYTMTIVYVFSMIIIFVKDRQKKKNEKHAAAEKDA